MGHGDKIYLKTKGNDIKLGFLSHLVKGSMRERKIEQRKLDLNHQIR
jgi:hypothetical protein